MKIILVRHGDPDYATDSLTEKGQREAEALAPRLRALAPDEVYCSPLGRARLTLKPSGLEPQILPWLREFAGYVINPRDGRKTIPWDLAPQYWTHDERLYDRNLWLENSLMQSGTVAEEYRLTCEGIDALLREHGYERDGGIYRTDHNLDTTILLQGHFAKGMTIIGYLTGVSPVVLWHNFFMPTTGITILRTQEIVKGQVTFRAGPIGDTSHLCMAGEPVSNAGLMREVAPDETEPYRH